MNTIGLKTKSRKQDMCTCDLFKYFAAKFPSTVIPSKQNKINVVIMQIKRLVVTEKRCFLAENDF